MPDHKRYDKSKTCIDCGKPSDLALNPSGLWCTDCEHARRARITAQMLEIKADLDAR